MDAKKTITSHVHPLANNSLLFSGGIVLLFVLWFAYLLKDGLPLTGPCVNTLITEVSSPDNKLKASVFVRDCGATTDYSTHVSIRAYASPFDPDKQSEVFDSIGKYDIKLNWVSPSHLTVSCKDIPSDKIFYQAIVCGGTAIQYK